MTHELILASQSPRRKQLLTDAGYRFIVDACLLYTSDAADVYSV